LHPEVGLGFILVGAVLLKLVLQVDLELQVVQVGVLKKVAFELALHII
jgi:hypothetical protein